MVTDRRINLHMKNNEKIRQIDHYKFSIDFTEKNKSQNHNNLKITNFYIPTYSIEQANH